MGGLRTTSILITGRSRGWMSFSKAERQRGPKHPMCRRTGGLRLSASLETLLGVLQRPARRGQLIKGNWFLPVLVLACLMIILTASSSPGGRGHSASSLRQRLLLCKLDVFHNSQPVNAAYGFTSPACIRASVYTEDCPSLLELWYRHTSALFTN